MGIRTEIRDEIRKETVTKIHGQPTSHDLTNLEKEIISILANIPTTLGGGNHGHVGVIMNPMDYMTGSKIILKLQNVAKKSTEMPRLNHSIVSNLRTCSGKQL